MKYLLNHKEYTLEALKTKYQTPDAVYNIDISDDKISVVVNLPMKLDITEKEAKILEANIHNALELVLKTYFNK
jgi:hypothetical protein